ncbi:YetF domain-containing protein [Pedococcus sp. KACC 23699]|uniref:YetF domain-containing protein n=1 Tax=Pedococcus sp. KACC 23699 TaxID=3149228 RepID=A0AAU7JZY1_9MICO
MIQHVPAVLTHVVAAAPTGIANDLFDLQMPVLEKVIRTVVIYLGIGVIIRVAGKRLLAQMNSLDLVVVLLLSNVVQNAIIGPDNSLLGGLIGAVVLVGFNAALDHWSMHSPRVAWILSGKATEVVTDGVVDRHALRRLGMTEAELANAVQQQGATTLSEVKRAALEPGGSVTVDLYRDAHAATIADLRRAVDALTAQLQQRPPHTPPLTP